MEFTSAEGERRWAALVRAAASTIVGLDFDGTLSPIVDDPAAAHIHPEASDVLVALAEQVAAVAVITGRPARQALDLGGLEEVGSAVGDAGKELYLFGQYGNERWTSTDRRVISPAPAARPLLVPARPAAAAARRPAPRTPSSRRRASPSPCTPAACRTPTPPSSGCCPRSASWPSATTWSSSPAAT